MKNQTRTELGSIRIHRDVIASITSIAALEIEGVAGLGSNLTSKLYAILSKKNVSGINVDIDKKNEIRISVPLVVKYGFYIPEVASKVQENISLSVEKMTDSVLKEININIQGIERR